MQQTTSRAGARLGKRVPPKAPSAAAFFAGEAWSAPASGEAPLRLPGGRRMTREDIKRVHHAKNPGELAKYDQRFLLNLKLAHDLTRHFGVSGASDKLFIELGPGPGMLTRALLARECRGVLGLEIDTKYNAHLEQIRESTGGTFQWANCDVMAIDEVAMMRTMYPAFAESLSAAARAYATLDDEASERGERAARKRAAAQRNVVDDDDKGRASWSEVPPSERLDSDGDGKGAPSRHSSLWIADPKVEVVGNLPFQHSASLAVRYAVDCSRRENLFEFGRVPCHIFFQKAVAQRAIAVPGTREYTKLSVVLQNYFRCAIRGTFTEAATYPKPDVYTALVSFEPRRAPLVDVDGGVLFNFTQMIMRHHRRRTTVAQSLRKLVPVEVSDYMLREVRADGDMLPTQLAVRDIALLAKQWAAYLEASQQFHEAKAGPRGGSPDAGFENLITTGRGMSSRSAAAQQAAMDDDNDDARDEGDELRDEHGVPLDRAWTAARNEFASSKMGTGGERPPTRFSANGGPMRQREPDFLRSSGDTIIDRERRLREGVAMDTLDRSRMR